MCSQFLNSRPFSYLYFQQKKTDITDVEIQNKKTCYFYFEFKPCEEMIFVSVYKAIRKFLKTFIKLASVLVSIGLCTILSKVS